MTTVLLVIRWMKLWLQLLLLSIYFLSFICFASYYFVPSSFGYQLFTDCISDLLQSREPLKIVYKRIFVNACDKRQWLQRIGNNNMVLTEG